ncbi:alpha-amylase family glycosyl hydrolase [Rhodovulum adriaticum]|uniref:Alpha-glucosidase n=1 Tax=Rhodovulum adriaticum TaxID=35804 RepID=A0A4V2SLB8_RHOAD|nr:alpha-amylase family glycosyl hydrolase [Rhodovulum adriaticum]MBK1636928.1 alpha-glucosidase [Rhodovulum adriaticum]TCP22796.1 alpha-glucosidase [Rhodovulum adriaticum]
MALATDPEWWRGAVIYQIYPRSFQDSNGDGIGDLLGIARRLPYVASLGVDAVWISPFFTSPMKDFGYDVSDYCDVDPMFGSLADFDCIVGTAHALGLRVMIDLVLSHSSDQHPWFVESRASRDNPRADWYVWADPKPDGTPPNNWLSIFGGSAWAWDGGREQYYLHNFLASQPDLNLHCAAVQGALLDVARFWLDRGVDGFRLDTINFYFADKALRDNPPLPPQDRNDNIAPRVNPYNHQLHLYDKNQPENLDFLRRFRAVLDGYGAVALGEVGDAQRDLEILGEYTGGGDKVQMCYAFQFLGNTPLSAAAIAALYAKLGQVAADGWVCWAMSNHDVVRHVTRWHLSPAALRAYLTLLICLRGTVCLYQGEELGLPEAEVPFEALQDPYGIAFWPEFKGRDGCRAPMVWQEQGLHGGFSAAPHTWLPVPPAHLSHAVDAQEHAPEAIIHHYRRAIAFRHANPVLARGALTDMRAEGDVLIFERVAGDVRMFCAINLGDAPAALDLPPGDWLAVGGEINAAHPGTDGRVHLGPWQPCLMLNNKGAG